MKPWFSEKGQWIKIVLITVCLIYFYMFAKEVVFYLKIIAYK